MLRRIRNFIRRAIVADVPAEMDLCLDCGKPLCSEEKFQGCERRKARAAEVSAAASGQSQLKRSAGGVGN